MRKLISFLLVFFLACPFSRAGVNFQSNADDKISFSSSGMSLNVGTVCMYLKPSFDQSAANFNQFFDSDTARHAFFHNSFTNEIQMYNDGRTTNFDSVTWSANTWYDFCFVYNKTGNVQKFYKDGVEQTASAGTGTWGSSSLGTNAYIGCRFNQVQSVGSVVSDVAIWSSVLTTAEIALRSLSKVKRVSCQISPSTLLNYWPLDEVSDGASSNGTSFKSICGSGATNATGDDGANNTGLTAEAERVLTYP